MKRRDFIKAAAAGGAGVPLLASGADLCIQGAGLPGGNPAKMATGLTVANLRTASSPTLAVKTSMGILDAVRAAKAFGKKVPLTTDALIRTGEGQLKEVIEAALRLRRKEFFLDAESAPFAPCITNPQKIVCVGINYKKHALETGLAAVSVPTLFNKYNNALNHHNGTVKTAGLPGDHFDYEAELVIVMGKRCQNVPEQEALDYVFGYCTGNDFSERTSQFITRQSMIGKTSDGFGPIGPYLVTADLVGDPNNLKIECSVNGEMRQSSSTSDMIFSCEQIIAFASKLFPLEAGDIIFTGTPEGVILGKPKDKQVWLKAGDKVRTDIEKLGTLDFTVV
jgi:2-keto-4-pentenoate hydratase/2-oxohepta-3-ene-1,7-dioic acid hydratase in catechol pathway